MHSVQWRNTCIWNGMEWNRLAGTGVATAQKIVQRPTPFLTRHSASRLGGVPPMNNLPHDHVRIDEYTQTGATLKKKRNKKYNGDPQESLPNKDLVGKR